MADYLEEAAAEARKARTALDSEMNDSAHEVAQGHMATITADRIYECRMELAAVFTVLAVIERCPLPPEMTDGEAAP